MQLEEQEALLEMWTDFLEGRKPSAALMREFYFEVISRSRYYRYGMAPEVFDLLVNGPFEVLDTGWAAGRRAGPAAALRHRAAERAA